MNNRTLGEIVAELLAASPAPPAEGTSAAEIAEAGAVMIERRQPILDALDAALAKGAGLDQLTRSRLDALRQTDAAWADALYKAQSAISQQLVALRKLGSHEVASASSEVSKFLNIKA